MALTTIGFDADDTLWHSESHFVFTTKRFCDLVAPWSTAQEKQHEDRADRTELDAAITDRIEHQLIEIERRNLQLLGYGAKAFTLSMIETAIEVSDGQVPASALKEILHWGHELLKHPVELIDGVEETLRTLMQSFNLLLITKGDLLHQESKIAQSGISQMFSGIDILSNKTVDSYQNLLQQHGIPASDFLMVGNSVRSDVLPVLQLGGQAVHVPYHVTWALEEEEVLDQPPANFHTCSHIGELPDLVTSLAIRGLPQ